jgi:hypothetical protein
MAYLMSLGAVIPLHTSWPWPIRNPVGSRDWQEDEEKLAPEIALHSFPISKAKPGPYLPLE